MDRGDEALQTLLRETGTSMGWRVGLLWERVGDGLTLRSSWHAGEEGRAFLERSATMIFARGIGLPGRAWHEQRPIWVEDFRQVASFPRAPAAGEDDLRAAIAVPVLDTQQEIIGVLEFLGHDAERPPPEAMAAMAALGQRVGQFISSTR
jgi:signal transduction protein with GAF and PtsI domain